MAVLLILASPPRTLRAIGGGSAAGPSHSRHFAGLQNLVVLGGIADINWQARPAASVANDPQRTSAA
jgi:hypothetical protein